MVPKSNMPAPLCLIENTSEGELRVRQDALRILADITQPIVVVAIVGLYRTGKSYLMNKLAGKNKGFSMASTIQSHTKGIWMWCLPHPQKANHTLVLLDTEGLGDIEKGDSNNENWIFVLAVLLSSAFVYNSVGTIDQQALEQLHYVMELSKHIKVKTTQSSDPSSAGSDSAQLMSFYPTFIWTVRDFTLDLELEGQPISADEYLENALKLLKGDSSKVLKLNLPRECIQCFFPRRKCFVFDRPASKDNLKRLEELQENDLEPDFVKQRNILCQYILKECRTKTLQDGHPVTGKLLANLTVTFVDTIRSGTVPCIENTVLALARTENSAAVQEAVSHYEKQMRARGKFPTATVKDFLDLQIDCERQAINIFMARSFKDEDNKYQNQLKALLKEKTGQLCAENEQLSMNHCRALLQQLFMPIEGKITQGFYSKPGGYLLFVKDQNEITEKYKMTTGKGVKADEILQEFSQAKESVATSIHQMDQKLTEKEKAIAAQQAWAKAAEEERKRKEAMAAAVQWQLEVERRRQEEEARQLAQRLEQYRLRQQQENERAIQQQLQEQAARIQEEARRRQEQLQAEARRLQEQWSNAVHHDDGDNCIIL